MEAYEILRKQENGSPNNIYRTIADSFMMRIWELLKAGENDIFSKLKAELLNGKPIYPCSDVVGIFYNAAIEDYNNNISNADRRNIDISLRDIIDNYSNEILGSDTQLTNPNVNNFGIDNRPLLDIVDEYIEFKTNIDTISPEAAAEVDRLAEMSDEEFEAEMNKPDDEEEEESDELDTPITQNDFDNLTIAELIEKYGSHDTALCLIGAEGGEEKFTMDDMKLFDAEDQELLRQEFGTSPDAPNTEEFNPEYDIPDEKLYPQE